MWTSSGLRCNILNDLAEHINGEIWLIKTVIAVKIPFTVRGLMPSYRDFSYNGENGYVFSKRGLNSAFLATQFH